MVRALIQWAVNNPLVVLLVVVGWVAVGIYSSPLPGVGNLNVEAYPDPAPAIVEVVAQFPGASAEEVERLVSVPLEVAFAGMPGLTMTRSKSLFGLCHIRNQFEYGRNFWDCRQEVINRLAVLSQPLPAGVTPVISPQNPIGEIYRYTLKSPQNRYGRDIYTLNDLKALQDWVLEREFRRVPHIMDVSSTGGTIKRYEIHPDPDRLKRYGVTLQQIQTALANSNQNTGADLLTQGHRVLSVRSFGLFGGGLDPAEQVLAFVHQALEEFIKNWVVEEVVLHTASAEVKQRVRDDLAGRQVEPPLTNGERGLARAIERLQAQALKGTEPLPPLSQDERGRIRTVERLWSEVLTGKRVSPPLTDQEQDLRRSVQRTRERLEAGLARRPTDPPLTNEERRDVREVDLAAATRAAARIREEENRRLHEMRQIVIASFNNRPVKIDHIVEGGPLTPGDPVGERGVVVGHQTRLGRVSLSKPAGADTDDVYRVREDRPRVWRDEDDKVQCIVLLRSGDQTKPAIQAVKEKVAELNDPEYGAMLPGVQIEPYYDRNDLVNVTNETVWENLLFGMVLVFLVLLMFLTNVRSAVIVAINIPLALLFAFTVLFFRGKSANLLSIGAVDFGIIVDSSVIMVENIYRHLSSGEYAELPMKERILRACREVERPLLFSTAIMVCAFIPLFTMRGPEGQLFGPMADTYAFALFGALVLAVILAPVLCLLLFRDFKPIHDNFLVRFLKSRYLSNLGMCLRFRWVTLLVMGSLITMTAFMIPALGQEFMPQLEEGNFWITATFPLDTSMDHVADVMKQARAIIAKYPEVEVLVPAIGRPDDGTDPTGFYRVEIFAPLRPMKEWPKVVEVSGWRRFFYGASRQRTKEELTLAVNQELRDTLPGIDWNFSQYIRDNVTEALAGVKGDNAVKIFGPDLDKLEEIAAEVKNRLEQVQGIKEVGIFNIKGQTNLEFRVNLDKCARWGVSAADVNNLISAAVGGKAQTSMIEGQKLFDVSLRWPKAYRSSEVSILDMQVDITNNQVFPVAGPGYTPAPGGSGVTPPPTVGSLVNTANPFSNTTRIRLRELVSPVGKNGAPDDNGSFERPAASTIYREQGKRMIAIKFNVRERDLGSAVAEAKERTKDLFHSPYRAVWAGEFNEMQKAQKSLLIIIPLSLGLILILLYLAFNSLLDAVVVFSNVVALAMGGIWSLWLTGTPFSISAAVGFVSLFGVAIMDGLLLISSFNAARARGMPLREAILYGAGNRVRAVMMTALTAILGLLPAALALRPSWNESGDLRWVEGIGSQTQRPLAIVVVGGMITTLFLTRYLMPVLYSFYGKRQPPASAGIAH
jgi:cobalt-zinc-cadmium resistance protein CzcA